MLLRKQHKLMDSQMSMLIYHLKKPIDKCKQNRDQIDKKHYNLIPQKLTTLF